MSHGMKCPSCELRFPDGRGVKVHVRAAHSRTLEQMADDGINHLTPSFRPMKDVLWEDVQRLKAENAALRAGELDDAPGSPQP